MKGALSPQERLVTWVPSFADTAQAVVAVAETAAVEADLAGPHVAGGAPPRSCLV